MLGEGAYVIVPILYESDKVVVFSRVFEHHAYLAAE
jgi:hypothetical protein